MDLLFHLLLPFLLLLLFGFRLKKHEYFILAFFSILPDFDRLILKSRQGFHSIIFIAIVLLALFFLSRTKKFSKTGKIVLFLAAFGMSSHLLFDLGGPLSFLYPFSENFYTLNANIQIINFFPQFVFSLQQSQGIAQGTGLLLSEQGIAVLLLSIALLLIQTKRKKKIHFFE